MKRFMVLIVTGILLVPIVSFAYITLPLGWSPSPIRSAAGVELYRHAYGGGYEYMQVVHLDQGARVVPWVDQYGTSESFYNLSLETHWDNFNNDSRAFSICNGQFFRGYTTEATELAHSLKISSDQLTGGYEMGSLLQQKMAFKVWPSEALINGWSESENTDSPIYLMGENCPDGFISFDEFVDKDASLPRGRTFLGVTDANPNGRFRTVLIYTIGENPGATQAHGAQIVRSFGGDRVMMMDGGVSTQLICQDSTYIGSSRPIPQTIGVYSADVTPPANPSNLSVNPSSCSQTNSFTFSWGAATDNESGIRGYRYRVGAGGSITPPTNQNPLPASTLSIGPSGFAPGTGDHIFFLYAENGVGLLSQMPAQVGFCYQPPAGPCGSRDITGTCTNPPHPIIAPASALAVPKR